MRRQVVLLSLLLSDTMGVRGDIVKLSSALMVFVVRSVVIACGH
jgi:hypothetical protein